MRLRPTSPSVPADLLSRFGAPERVYGPNLRFRIISAVCGLVLVGAGVALLLEKIAGLPLGDLVSDKLSAMMIAVGAVIIVGSRLVPLHWVFICPGGLIRKRGGAWDNVAWTDVARFEDATLDKKTATVRQFRIVTAAGEEWGFLADQITDYESLHAELQRRIEQTVKPRARASK